ncbi:MAG: phosphate ABC transporter, permease protein PstA [Ignavibacteriales bacterium CG12_big_fil_rev_8_21_14_0_65_30_8]|nr:MAG: phosphate ABC transporter, permease protein PstA [Ignavibacteriales bacterium CG12_big_fil_rev_8_21_14_0_65_30_8]
MKNFWKKGDPYILFTGAGLIIALGMVLLMLGIIIFNGMGSFWPKDISEYELKDGTKYLGEVWETKKDYVLQADSTYKTVEEVKIKTGNRDIYGTDFKWLYPQDIVSAVESKEAVCFERWEYGNFYGFINTVSIFDKKYTLKDKDLIERANEALAKALSNREKEENIENKLNDLMRPLSKIQRELSLIDINENASQTKINELNKKAEELQNKIVKEYTTLSDKLAKLKEEDSKILVSVTIADGRNIEIAMSKILRLYQPNKMSILSKSFFYVEKVWEFLSVDPRESNTEGGVFPAIFGTVIMVLLMSIAVVPFGVAAAIYLNEYAKQGFITRMIRLSVVNLAGVPSIVFGIFGLGFFIYIIGGTIDQLFFAGELPAPTFGTGGILWASLTLALLTLPVVVVATEEGLLAVPKENKNGALALGATKWQMIRKVVLPNIMPGILTGMILAISRGAGEVAPLMITGVVKLAPALPFDLTFPFLHLDRKFMHLGFHIYDVGFQSPNVEAALPMVYTTAFFLVLIVVTLNLIAIYFRNNLRKKYKTSTF